MSVKVSLGRSRKLSAFMRKTPACSGSTWSTGMDTLRAGGHGGWFSPLRAPWSTMSELRLLSARHIMLELSIVPTVDAL